jgi:hypothetical protein
MAIGNDYPIIIIRLGMVIAQIPGGNLPYVSSVIGAPQRHIDHLGLELNQMKNILRILLDIAIHIPVERKEWQCLGEW